MNSKKTTGIGCRKEVGGKGRVMTIITIATAA